MFSVWKLYISKMHKNKAHNILMALIILLSTLLLSTALVMLGNTSNSYMAIHGEQNGAHEILELKDDIYDPNEIHTWWQAQDGVAVSNVMRYKNLTNVAYQGNTLDVELYMTDASTYSPAVDRLQFADGKEQAQPDAGTAWIPTSLAYSNEISVGDELVFMVENKPLSLQVSGIVVDLPYCAPFANSARIWMNETDYNQKLGSGVGSDSYMIALRYDNYEGNRAYWDAFESYLGTPYLESVKTFESLSAFYMVINQLIGFVMVFLAIAMMVSAVASIGFIISDDILSNYKVIGIVRSLGMTPSATTAVYVLQYTVLASGSVAVGIILSYFLSGTIINSSLSYLRLPGTAVSFHFSYIAVGVFVSLLVIILTCVFIFANKTRKIEPVQAIRYGISETSYGKLSCHKTRLSRKIARFNQLPVLLAVGLRSMCGKVRSNIFIVLVTALMASVLTFGFTFINSIIHINQTIQMWGYDSSDISVEVKNLTDGQYADLINTLSTDERIANYNPRGDINSVVPAQADEATGETIVDAMSVWLSVVDGSYEEIGFTNLEGRDPVGANEISVGINLAKTYNLQVGDTIDIYIQGEKCSFTITGTYQAISNMAYSGRVGIEGIQQINPQYSMKDGIFVNVKNGVSAEKYVEELLSKYGSNLAAFTREELVDQVFSLVVLILVVPLLIIGLAFIAFALIIIYCNCRISIKKEMKTYGIYKSIGMSSKSIRFSLSFGVLVLELIGAVIGAVLGIILLPNLLDAVLSNYGIVEMPLVINTLGVVLVVVAGVLLASMGSWFASKIIKRTSPRLLTSE